MKDLHTNRSTTTTSPLSVYSLTHSLTLSKGIVLFVSHTKKSARQTRQCIHIMWDFSPYIELVNFQCLSLVSINNKTETGLGRTEIGAFT